MDVSRLQAQKEKFRAILDQYRDLCAQEKDVQAAIDQLKEKRGGLRTDITRLQGAMGLLREDIQELEKGVQEPAIVSAVGIPSVSE